MAMSWELQWHAGLDDADTDDTLYFTAEGVSVDALCNEDGIPYPWVDTGDNDRVPPVNNRHQDLGGDDVG